ncbi:Uncharacterised protein [Streptococcus suis]|nr:Uncharacterised protein [Streptococcus suis]
MGEETFDTRTSKLPFTALTFSIATTLDACVLVVDWLELETVDLAATFVLGFVTVLPVPAEVELVELATEAFSFVKETPDVTEIAFEEVVS